MVRLASRRPRDDAGAVAILVGICATVLFLIAALVVDLGLARDVSRQSQNAADASALAAGNRLYVGGPTPDFAGAVSEAKAYALANFGVAVGEWDSCDDADRLAYVPAGGSPCISFDDALLPTQVRVKMPTHRVSTGFGAIAGVQTIPIQSAARAALDPAQLTSCSLCVLGAGPHYTGNGDLPVTGAGVHFNGSLSGHQNSHITATGGTITVEGAFNGPTYNPAAANGPAMGDPLASLSLPPSITGLSSHTNPCEDGPGIYGGFSDFPKKDDCVLDPGLYVVTGTWVLGNKDVLSGTGVTLFVTCASADYTCAPPATSGGELDGKNGSIDLTAPLGSPVHGAIRGFAVIYDRHNSAPLGLQGNGDSSISGNVYAVSSQVEVKGNACAMVDQGAIVVDSIYLNGNKTCLGVDNGTTQTWQQPPADLHLDQ